LALACYPKQKTDKNSQPWPQSPSKRFLPLSAFIFIPSPFLPSRLSDEGYKEVTLLGQNVNSYNFLGHPPTASEAAAKEAGEASAGEGKRGKRRRDKVVGYAASRAGKTVGFENIAKPLVSSAASAADFTELVAMVSDVDPEMRVRFTSPHPKDFPDGTTTPFTAFYAIFDLACFSRSHTVRFHFRRDFPRSSGVSGWQALTCYPCVFFRLATPGQRPAQRRATIFLPTFVYER
jgi:hypothetical protein